MWPDAGTPYLDMYTDDMRKTLNRIRNRRDATVVHHETCPCCGKKLVNLYLGETEKFEKHGDDAVRKTVNEWKCKACWDKEKGE